MTTHLSNLNLKADIIQGGAAGDHTLAAIAAEDEIAFVGHWTTAVSATFGFTSTSLADLTSEFTAGAGVINNAAGTATTNDQLLVLWFDRSE